MEKRILTNLPTDGLREGVDFRDDPPKKELNMTQLVYNFIWINIKLLTDINFLHMLRILVMQQCTIFALLQEFATSFYRQKRSENI